MDIRENILPGMKREDEYIVSEAVTAIHVGSGSMRVLATPWLIAFMEHTARDLLADHLPQGLSSVGVHVDVHHLAPSPVGFTIRILAEVQSVEGPRVDFLIQAWDELEQVGQGLHQRVVIDEDRFLRRVAGKTLPQPPE